MVTAISLPYNMIASSHPALSWKVFKTSPNLYQNICHVFQIRCNKLWTQQNRFYVQHFLLNSFMFLPPSSLSHPRTLTFMWQRCFSIFSKIASASEANTSTLWGVTNFWVQPFSFAAVYRWHRSPCWPCSSLNWLKAGSEQVKQKHGIR